MSLSAKWSPNGFRCPLKAWKCYLKQSVLIGCVENKAWQLVGQDTDYFFTFNNITRLYSFQFDIIFLLPDSWWTMIDGIQDVSRTNQRYHDIRLYHSSLIIWIQLNCFHTEQFPCRNFWKLFNLSLLSVIFHFKTLCGSQPQQS